MTNEKAGILEAIIVSTIVGFGFALGVFCFWSMAYTIAKVIL